MDFGCATGMLTINIAKHFPNAMVYGVDIEEKAIAKAKENKKKENISNVEFVLSSGELMDKTWEKKFDWIIIVDVLHDLPNPDQCLAEVKRVLKDDGIVSAIDPAFHSDQKMNVGNPNASMHYVFSTFICLPCSMSAEPAVGHGVGWGIENRVAFLKAREFKILGAEDKGLLHFQNMPAT